MKPMTPALQIAKCCQLIDVRARVVSMFLRCNETAKVLHVGVASSIEFRPSSHGPGGSGHFPPMKVMHYAAPTSLSPVTHSDPVRANIYSTILLVQLQL
jgi:hypothetical protein